MYVLRYVEQADPRQKILGLFDLEDLSEICDLLENVNPMDLEFIELEEPVGVMMSFDPADALTRDIEDDEAQTFSIYLELVGPVLDEIVSRDDWIRFSDFWKDFNDEMGMRLRRVLDRIKNTA